MELSTRLQAVADWVPKGARLADVGTDHGFLPVWLVKYGVIDFAIAADLREKPLETAKRTAERHGLEDRISFRLCDGLADIRPEEVDTVSIAGMGGETIVTILEAAPWTWEQGTRLLLQPQSGSFELRTFLHKKGYRILRETIAREENRFYILMEVERGTPEPMTVGELWAGKNYDHPQRGAYLEWLSGVLGKAAKGMQKSEEKQDSAQELCQVIEDLQRMKKEWETWQSP